MTLATEQIKKQNIIKIILGGDGGIGKTTFASTLNGKPFKEQEITIGVDLHYLKVIINEELHNLLIWDLAGQDQFRFILNSYIKGAQGIILGFDVSRLQSFRNLNRWVRMFKKNTPNLPIVLFGNKIDLGYHPIIKKENIFDFITQNNIHYYDEMSAKEKIGIDKPLIKLLKLIDVYNPDKDSIEIIMNRYNI